MPRIQIVVSVQGGVVQDVFCSAEEAAELIMVDWDAEGCDRLAPDVARVVEPQGDERFAFISKCLTEPLWTMAGTDVEAAIQYAQAHSFRNFESMTRRFEFVEGASTKLWEITVNGAETVVRWGRIGTDGQSQTKTCADAAAATREAEKQIKQKLVKGYTETSLTA